MRIPLTILFTTLFLTAFSQNVENLAGDVKNIFKQDPLSIQGGLGANLVFYDAQEEAVRTNNPKEGILLSMDDGGHRVVNGSNIEIENKHADLEDKTLGISVQHKLSTGAGSTATRENLAKACDQLRGSGGEFPSHSTTVAYVRITNPMQSEANLPREGVLSILRIWHMGNNVNYTGISQVIIENTTGKHIFDVASEIIN